MCMYVKVHLNKFLRILNNYNESCIPQSLTTGFSYDLFKTYVCSYNTFLEDNLFTVRPLKVLPRYLKVASG